MRLLAYFSATLLILMGITILGIGCSNPDSIPDAGFSLTPSPVKVVFTDPQFRVEGSHFSGTSDPFMKMNMESVGLTKLEESDLVAKIDGAQSTIDLCTTRIANQGMVLRLVNIANRGVQVRIVTEQGYFSDPNSVPLIEQLLDAGVLIRTDNDTINRMMHERYWIIDHRFVLCGSGDLLDATFERSANNTLIFDTPLTINGASDVSAITTITDAFFFDFTQMFDRNLFGSAKETMLKHTFKIGVDVEIYFGPNDGLRARVINELNSIDQSMFYAINQATDGAVINLIDALVQAGQLGIAGVYDGPSNGIALPNATAYSYPNMNGMNHKFMVIDVPNTQEDFKFFTAASSNDPVVLTGSASWTNGGFDLNDETMVVVHDLTLAFQFSAGEANTMTFAAANSGVVYGFVRSAQNNIGLAVTVTIESNRVSAYFPGTGDTPVEADTDPADDGFYGAAVACGELFRLDTSKPEGHLFPEGKFLYGNTFLLLPGASYEANFYPKLSPTGTGTGGT